MGTQGKKARTRAHLLILLAALLGLAGGLYDYVTPATGIDGAEGVLLVIVSTALMLVAVLALMALRPGLLTGLLVFLILLDIVGTGVAAYFLESPLLMGAMLLAALGWLLRLGRRRSLGASAGFSA